MNNLNSIRKNYNQQVNTRNMDAEINSIYGGKLFIILFSIQYR